MMNMGEIIKNALLVRIGYVKNASVIVQKCDCGKLYCGICTEGEEGWEDRVDPIKCDHCLNNVYCTECDFECLECKEYICRKCLANAKIKCLHKKISL